MHNVHQFFHKYFYGIMGGYFLVLLYVFGQDPFFGDSITSTSRLATNIYENGTIFYAFGSDPGHPPLYSLFMALSWKLFGKSLLVSHIYGMLCCVFLLMGFRKLCSLYLNSTYTNYATLLVMAHPTFITQNAMMLNTAMLMGLFLFGVYYLLSNKALLFVLVTSIMMLTHLQGAYFLAAFAVGDFYLHWKKLEWKQFFVTRFFVYAIPFSVFMLWMIVHYKHAGWWIKSPDFTDTAETNSIGQIVKGLVYCIWRFIDYGMIIPIVLYAYFQWKRKSATLNTQVFWVLVIVTSIILSITLKNTIAHRYFLGLECWFLILFMNVLPTSSLPQRIIYITTFLFLCIGSFIYYPGKTIADANIQYRGYFEIDQYAMKSYDDTSKVYSKAPIANPSKFIDLGSDNVAILRIGENLDSLPIVISSNICAEFTHEEQETLSHWYGRSFEHGAVYMNYYLNPKFYDKPEGWQLRSPGGLELLILKLKKQYK